MSGHNKWSTIKHKKGKADAARGKIFSRLVKEITVSAREGGRDPDTNARLRVAIESAKSQNMPSENIEKAIKRGTGEIEGVNYEEITYEAYGPGGVAIMIDVLTDNRNRTAAEIRNLLSKGNGHLGSKNSVAYIFKSVGQIRTENNDFDEDAILEVGLDAGVEDIEEENNSFIVTTSVSNLFTVKNALEGSDIEIDYAEMTKIPDNTVIPSARDADKALKLLEALEEHDDVQAVYTNLEMPE